MNINKLSKLVLITFCVTSVAYSTVAQSSKHVPAVNYLLLEGESGSTTPTSPEIVLNQLKAFPTASGAGSVVTGGRGGKTCFVDTLVDSSNGSYSQSSDSYSGSLRYCLEENHTVTKTVVFLVGGEFKLTQGDIRVNKGFGGNITIAGQTARDLGGVHITQGTHVVNFDKIFNVNLRYVDFKLGLAFTDSSVSIGTDEVIIDRQSYPIFINRNDYKAFKVGPWTYIIDGTTGNIIRETDGLRIDRAYDVIVDHVTTAYHADESLSIGGFHEDNGYIEHFKNITLQRSLMLPGIVGHNVGSIIGNYSKRIADTHVRNIDVHHNLWVNATHRFPNTGGGSEAEIRIFNNVIYGWRSRLSQIFGDAKVDIFNNYYKKSPATGTSSQRLDRLFKFNFIFNWTGSPLIPSIHLSGNFIEGVIEDLNADNWPAITHHNSPGQNRPDLPPSNTPLSRTYQRQLPIPTNANNKIEFSDALSAYDSVLNDVGEGVRFDANGNTYFKDPVASKYLDYVISGTGPSVLPSSEDWIFPVYPSSTTNRNRFDSDGVPLNWEVPGNIINNAGYSKQELYLAEMAGDFHRLKPE